MINRENGSGSIQSRADKTEFYSDGDVVSGMPFAYIVNVGQAGDSMIPWQPIYPNGRDIQLKNFSRQETMLSSAIYTLKTRAQTLNFEVNGPKRARDYALDVLNNPGLGDSFIDLTGKLVDDLLTADNGAFLELWRAGNPRDENSPVVGMGHLDSRQCWRTFDPEYPVIYTNPETHERYRLHKNQVIMTADNIQPVELARGIGYCATSRAIQWARVMRSIMTYTDEKISGRFTRAVGFVSGMTTHHLKKGLTQNQENADDAGYVVYNGIPFFAAPGMSAGTELKIVLQDLASIPDGFDFEMDVTLYAYILAWVFGTDARDFWPATVSGATKADASVQNMKARGKGIGWIIQTLESMFRRGLPASVTFEYDYSDDEQDMMQAQIQQQRVTILSTLVRDGAIEPWEERALAIAEGIIDGEVLDSLTPPATSDDTAENAPDAQESGDQADDQAEDDQKPEQAESEAAAKTLASFQQSINSAVRGLWSGALSILSAHQAMNSAIARGLNQAWIEGAGECGIQEGDLTDEEWAALNLEIFNQQSYVPGFLNAIVTGSEANGGAIDPLFSRAELWVNQYNHVKGMAKLSACADQKLIWVLGKTEKHCPDCSRAAGKVYRGSTWAKNGWETQSPRLACGGHRCDCHLDPTDEPITKGRPIILGGL